MWMSSERCWFVRPTRKESETGLPGLAPAHGDCCACAQRYLAGFFEQVKSRDFLTLTIQNSHEENQIHRSSDHCDLKRTGTRPESIGHLPKTRHQRCDILQDRKSTRLNSSHVKISYAVFCLK